MPILINEIMHLFIVNDLNTVTLRWVGQIYSH